MAGAQNLHRCRNPASELELPRLRAALPAHVLVAERGRGGARRSRLERPLGVRDRAILETLVLDRHPPDRSSRNLKLYDLDLERGTLMVRQGKGKKDRMVPIGERALRVDREVHREVRPELVVAPTTARLFLTIRRAVRAGRLTHLVKRVRRTAAGIGKTGSCHLFRHTMATLMLENGADIRFIQAMLGHAQLTTTRDLHARVDPQAQGDPRAHASRSAARVVAGVTQGHRERRRRGGGRGGRAASFFSRRSCRGGGRRCFGLRRSLRVRAGCSCVPAGLGHMWTAAAGPTDEAIALFEAGGGPLSSGERVVLLSAWAFWNSAEKVTLADVVYRLDDKNLRAVATLMLALADGGPAIDEWIAAMEADAGRGGDGQGRSRPSLRAGRLGGRDPDPR